MPSSRSPSDPKRLTVAMQRQCQHAHTHQNAAGWSLRHPPTPLFYSVQALTNYFCLIANGHTAYACSPQKSKEERWCSFDVSLASNWGQAASQLSATCSSYDLGHPSAHQLSQQHCADPDPMQFPGGFRVYVVNEACHVQGTCLALQWTRDHTLHPSLSRNMLSIRKRTFECDILRGSIEQLIASSAASDLVFNGMEALSTITHWCILRLEDPCRCAGQPSSQYGG